MPDAREYFTAEEIAEIIRKIDVDAEVVTEEHEVDGPEVHIDCESGDVSWWIHLGSARPFYGSMILNGFTTVENDPHHFVNDWNVDHPISTAMVFNDEENDTVLQLNDGEFLVNIRRYISFSGMVTSEHLEYTLLLFHDDVCELHGVENIDENEDVSEEKPTQRAMGAAVSDIILEGIHTLLELKGPLTSRAIARESGVPKHEVNQLLYKNIDQFVRHADQPPKWESRRK